MEQSSSETYKNRQPHETLQHGQWDRSTCFAMDKILITGAIFEHMTGILQVTFNQQSGPIHVCHVYLVVICLNRYQSTCVNHV